MKSHRYYTYTRLELLQFEHKMKRDYNNSCTILLIYYDGISKYYVILSGLRFYFVSMNNTGITFNVFFVINITKTYAIESKFRKHITNK